MLSRLLRKFARVVGIVVLLLGVAGGLLIWHAGVGRTSPLEAWIGTQLQAVANGYLNPRLSFDDLNYTYPDTVELEDFKLTQDGVDVLACGRVTVKLARVPTYGEPVVVREFVLDEPTLRLVSVRPGATKFVGLSDLIRKDATTTKPAGASASSRDKPSLRDFFTLRRIELKGGTIEYDPRLSGTEPMRLDDVSTVLELEEQSADGWHKLDARLDRAPLLTLGVAGEVSLDTLAVRGGAVTLSADLSRASAGFLPPQLQRLVDKYDVRGRLRAEARGAGKLGALGDARASATVTLADGFATYDKYRLPIDRLAASLVLDGRALDVSMLNVDALDGRARAYGKITLAGPLPTELNLDTGARPLKLEALLRESTASGPEFAGRVNLAVNVKAPLLALLAQLPGAPPELAAEHGPLPAQWGGGELHLEDAKLVALPLIDDLGRLVVDAAGLVKFWRREKPADERLDAAFVFREDKIVIEAFQYVTPAVAARGHGAIDLKGQLDLRMNAGPLERMQAGLGKVVGGVLAYVTDSLARYRVTGTVRAPKVNVEVGGAVGRGLGGLLQPGEKQ